MSLSGVTRVRKIKLTKVTVNSAENPENDGAQQNMNSLKFFLKAKAAFKHSIRIKYNVIRNEID